MADSRSNPISAGHIDRLSFLLPLLGTENDRRLRRLRPHLDELDLLVLNENGLVPTSMAGANSSSDDIAISYERLNIDLNTSHQIGRRDGVLGHDRMDAAALDRLTHRCAIVEPSGESYCPHDAKRRRWNEPKS